jgi:hypothetical protein
MLVQKIKAKEDILQSFRRNDKNLRFFLTPEGEDWLKKENNLNFSMNNCFKKIEEKQTKVEEKHPFIINLILK